MRLISIKLKNFRGYKDEISISFGELTAFIGKNDAGKSTILEALEIFFNNKLIECEREDLSINSSTNDIEISCIFDDLPTEIIIDTGFPTSLSDEYLLNIDGLLEIKKIYTATVAKPKEKVYIKCNHPTSSDCINLLELKRQELKNKAMLLGIDVSLFNASINSSIRKSIRDNCSDLQIQEILLPVDKEDSKKIYEKLNEHLPLFALFQSDRQSRDDDKEVVDPMKIAIQQALQELEVELEEIKRKVQEKALLTAERTLIKLQEMSPELAKSLIPEFKTEPKFDSQFKLTIKSDNNIPINKRGSGVRRLILLNFFRAEAERRSISGTNQSIIYAFEEPETSQHPDHQEMLIKSFIELSLAQKTQIILTTHTPNLAGLLPLESLRFIKQSAGIRVVEQGNETVFEEIVNSLGLLSTPFDKNTKALLLVEGKADFIFINHTAKALKGGGFISHTFQDKKFAIIPVGGCGNLKHWTVLKLAAQFGVPYCVFLDSDKGTIEENRNHTQITNLNSDGIKAYVTKKREPENYINPDVINTIDGSRCVFSEIDDAKKVINSLTQVACDNVLETFWTRMSVEQIRNAEKYTKEDGSEGFEFTDIFNDFLSLV